MSGQFLTGIVEGKVSEAKALPALKEPNKYKVVLHNDDYTPMDFVVEVLKHFFHFSEEKATQLMFQGHLQGSAGCGVFTRDVAETSVFLVNEYARTNQHPLLCSMKQE